jgi:predicted RNA binding protein YcfA (HicA-like mRNA interferase family)
LTKKNKQLEKLKKRRGTIQFKEVKTILEREGYKICGINGSHHKFQNERGQKINIPVHNNKIKNHYLKEILKLIEK